MKKIIIMTLIGWMFVSAAFAVDISAPNFTKANAAYRDGKYDEAIADYEAILTSGFESGPIYYNLGNSYFKKQQIGKAILNYERAKRLLPRDSDVTANLQFSLSEVPADVRKPLNAWDKLWYGHVQFYSFNEMILVLTLLLFLLGSAHLVTLYFQWNAGRWVMSVLAVLFLIFAYGLQLKVVTQREEAVIIEPASARFEPHDKATTYFELSPGQRVRLLEREGDWSKIERRDGKAGWVIGNSLENI